MLNEELHSLHSSPNFISMVRSRKFRWVGHVACMGQKRRGLVNKPGGKRLLERPECRWENSIKMDVKDTIWGGMAWLNLAEDRYK
jgi:hypothetical protein